MIDVAPVKSISKPTLMAEDTIRRLNSEGFRERFEPLKIVDEAREVLERMPEGKSGIVLGSGPNTKSWKTKGWKTLDIDPSSNADFIVDANQLETLVTPASQDFLMTEFITFDPKGENGVGRGRLLQQANKALKEGATLVVRTAHQEGMATYLPDRRDFVHQMTDYGFQTVVELHQIIDSGGNIKEQEVVYYGKKVAEGYVQNRPQT